MKNFRLVILDYPKLIIEDSETQKILSDIITAKQLNFERTDKNYIVMDKHDMVGTHFLIYDITSFYNPKLIFALRSTYENRAQKHGIKIPLEDYIGLTGDIGVHEYNKYKADKGSLLDCNAWFVDQEFSFKNKGLPLSELGFFMVCSYALRLGYDHIGGCTNEKYKASRWIKKIGPFREGITFEHPLVPDVHQLALVEHFYPEWIRQCNERYGELLSNTYELIPKEVSAIPMDLAIENFLRAPENLSLAA